MKALPSSNPSPRRRKGGKIVFLIFKQGSRVPEYGPQHLRAKVVQTAFRVLLRAGFSHGSPWSRELNGLDLHRDPQLRPIVLALDRHQNMKMLIAGRRSCRFLISA